jgi:CubicO group peptidase (beta-lactamase class C family)
MTPDFEALRGLLDAGVAKSAFPCAVAEVGTSKGPAWTHATGALTYDGDAWRAAPETIFDLASLTKVVVTTSVAMRAIDAGRLALEHPVGRWIPQWRGRDREHVTVRDLLAHSAGLSAHLPCYMDCQGRAEFQQTIATLALEYVPRSASVYSDLGFILLGFALSDATGSTLDAQFEAVRGEAGLGDLAYLPPAEWRARCAPSGFSDWRRRHLVGEVLDDNCHALGGIAGHAGLFGTAPAMGRFARWVLATLNGRARTPLAHPATLREFITRVPVPDSSRALGWDTMLPTSSCGPEMSPTAIGHTGFTGTSLWIDWERDAYFVLLTNRTCPSGAPPGIQQLRADFHTAAIHALFGDPPARPDRA